MEMALWCIAGYLAIGGVVCALLVGTTRGEEGNGWGLVVLLWPFILVIYIYQTLIAAQGTGR
jgi:hypothetical protein